MNNLLEFKLVILGGGGVGKSALTVQFIKNYFILEYDPTIEDNYKKQLTVDDQTCILDILDTAGQEEFSALRDHYMRNGQGFYLTYSVTHRHSFDVEISRFRDQILKVKDIEKVPIVLCGNKCDLENARQVSKKEGEDRAKEWNCPFFETSALQKINVDESFYTLVREIRKLYLEQNPPTSARKTKGKKSHCNLL